MSTHKHSVPNYAYSSLVSSINTPGVYINGFEFDGTVCFRKGARLGPNAFRDVAEGIESYSPYINLDLESSDKLFDLGNLIIPKDKTTDENFLGALKYFEKALENINLKKDQVKLLTLGGEHSISIAPIKKYLEDYPNLLIIHLDAHADLRDGYLGHHYSHASIIRRSMDLFSKDNSLIQYGIRSGTKDEYDFMKKNKTICSSRNEFLEKVQLIDEQRPVYLTLDLDYFDPSFLPGTGTPEAGGEDFHSYISLLKILKNKNFVGADIVELAPDIDPTGNSAVFGTKVLRETCATLLKSFSRENS
jgi:agmatinase